MKRMPKKVRSLFALTTAALLLFVVGCSSKTAAPNASAQTQSPTLQKVLDDKVLKVGITETIPNAWKNPKTGEWEGYNVEVAKALAKDLNVKLELVEAPLDTWVPQMNQQKFAVHMLGWFMTTARAVQVDFTVPVFRKGYAVVIRSDRTDITSLSDLNNEKYSVTGLLGGSEETVAKSYMPKAKGNWLKATNPLDAAMTVKNKQNDAWVYPADIMPVFLTANAWAKQLNPEPIWVNPLAYAIRKGDPEWKIFLDAFITRLQESGAMGKYILDANQKAYDQVLSAAAK